MKRSTHLNIIIAIGIFAFVAILADWLAWFFALGVAKSRTMADTDYAIDISYEQAFPLPDSFVALAALVGVFGVWRMRDWGFLSMQLAAGETFFLGLKDLFHYLWHNMFVPLNGAAAFEPVIVLLIMSPGPILTILFWKHRQEFIQ